MSAPVSAGVAYVMASLVTRKISAFVTGWYLESVCSKGQGSVPARLNRVQAVKDETGKGYGCRQRNRSYETGRKLSGTARHHATDILKFRSQSLVWHDHFF